MKKIYCDLEGKDYILINSGEWGRMCAASIDISTISSGRIVIGAGKIRKLRKQLKKALIAIEGEGKEEGWKSGDKVFLVHGCTEGDDYCTSPSVIGIDISKTVTLIEERNSRGKWELEYKDVNNEACIGYAYEKDFKRA